MEIRIEHVISLSPELRDLIVRFAPVGGAAEAPQANTRSPRGEKKDEPANSAKSPAFTAEQSATQVSAPVATEPVRPISGEATAAAAVEPAKTATASTAAPAATGSEAVTREVMRATMTKAMSAKSAATVQAMLKEKFGVSGPGAVPPEQYGAVNAALLQLIGG